jgi:hypothetical protein
VVIYFFAKLIVKERKKKQRPDGIVPSGRE